MCPSITLVILVGEEVVCQYVNKAFAIRADQGSTGVRPGECLNNGFYALRALEAATTFAIRAIALLLPSGFLSK